MSPFFFAAMVGFAAGFIIGIPVGPVNLTIMNEGARFGFFRASIISLGAAIMEVTYCAVAFTGFSSFFGNPTIKAGMEVFSFAFLMFLGIKFLMTTSVTSTNATADKIGAGIEKRLHPRSGFMIGFVRTLGNPGVLLFWIIVAANFISREWVSPDWPGKIGCITGVFLGTFAWFLGLSYASSLGYGKFTDKTLLRMERFSGVCLIVMAFIHGGMLMHEIVHHHHNQM
ncbi:MAG TPA: LysE family transporter [Verrucomicrobiae bacterium]|jgi:threonine/homoserine/homoserine lactone efflux protein|nr:LysE family transporter [Verrucomicrobiae bacterium]